MNFLELRSSQNIHTRIRATWIENVVVEVRKRESRILSAWAVGSVARDEAFANSDTDVLILMNIPYRQNEDDQEYYISKSIRETAKRQKPWELLNGKASLLDIMAYTAQGRYFFPQEYWQKFQKEKILVK